MPRWPTLDRPTTPRAVRAAIQGSNRKLRRTTYQGDEDLTRDQAIRDIQALVRHGLVRGRGNAASRVYVIDGEAREAHLAAMDSVASP